MEAPQYKGGVMKKESGIFPDSFWWREEDSNLRPLGYEPNELPLLHPAMCRFTGAKVVSFQILCNSGRVKKC